MSLAQWLGSILVAQGIRGAFGVSRALYNHSWTGVPRAGGDSVVERGARDEEEGLSAAAEYAQKVKATKQSDPYSSSFSGR